MIKKRSQFKFFPCIGQNPDIVRMAVFIQKKHINCKHFADIDSKRIQAGDSYGPVYERFKPLRMI